MRNALFILMLCLFFANPGIAEEKFPRTIDSFRNAIPITTYNELILKFGKPDSEIELKGPSYISCTYHLPDRSRIVAVINRMEHQKTIEDPLILSINWGDAKGFIIEELQESAARHDEFKKRKKICSHIEEILPKGWAVSAVGWLEEPFGYKESKVKGTHLLLYQERKRIDLWLMPPDYRPIGIQERWSWMPAGTFSLLGRTKEMAVYQFSEEKIETWPDWKKAITRQLGLE